MNNTIEGTIIDTTGPIYAERNGTRIELNKGDGVFESDIIITGSETTADIEYRDGTKSRIAPNTKFKLTDYEFGPADDEPSFIVDLTEGAIRTVTGEIVKLNPDAFEVVTPLATVGIRGTEFTVESDENGTSASAYYVTEEKPMVITDSNGQQVELSQPYQMVNVSNDGSGAPLEVDTLTRDGLIETVGEDYASLVTQIPTSAQSQGQWDSTNSAMTYATENSQDRATDGEVEDEENLENQSTVQEARSADSEEGEATPTTEQTTPVEENNSAQETSTDQAVAEVASLAEETEEAEDIVTEALQSNLSTLASNTSNNSSLLDTDTNITDSAVSPENELPQTTPFDQSETSPSTPSTPSTVIPAEPLQPSEPTQPPVDPTPPPTEPTDPPVEPEKPTDPPVEPEEPTDPPVEPEEPTDPPVEPEEPTDPPVEPEEPTEPVKQYAIVGHFDVFDENKQIQTYNSETNEYEENSFFTEERIESLATAESNYHARLSGLQIFGEDLELGAGDDGLYIGSELNFKENTTKNIDDGTYKIDPNSLSINAAMHTANVNTGTGNDHINAVMYNTTGGINNLLYDSTLTTGEGNDTVNLYSSYNGAEIGLYQSTVDLGAGNDTINLSQFNNVQKAIAGMFESEVLAGEGDDRINLSGNITNSTINAGEGNDTVTLTTGVYSTVVSESTIDTGDGDDTITMNYDEINNSTINTGNGDDTVTLSGTITSTTIDLGDGNNTIIIKNASAVEINTGDGNDVIYHADLSKVDPNLNPTLDDSGGIDVLITNTENLYINSNSNQGIEIVISGVESDDFTSLEDLGVEVVGDSVTLDNTKWGYDETSKVYNSLDSSKAYILSFDQLTVDSNDSYTLTLNSQNP